MRDRPLKVRFCGDCGRMILVGFAFCPYCGSPVPSEPEGGTVGPSDSASGVPAASSPSPAAAVPRDPGEARIILDRLIRKLEVLDAEMEEWAVNSKR